MANVNEEFISVTTSNLESVIRTEQEIGENIDEKIVKTQQVFNNGLTLLHQNRTIGFVKEFES